MTVTDLLDQLQSTSGSARVFLRFSERNGHGQLIASCDFQIAEIKEERGNVILETDGQVLEQAG